MKKLDEYKTVGEWREDAKEHGYSVPLPMCHCLSQIMKQYDVRFSEAYMFLDKKGKIILREKMYFFDMSANRFWE